MRIRNVPRGRLIGCGVQSLQLVPLRYALRRNLKKNPLVGLPSFEVWGKSLRKFNKLGKARTLGISDLRA